MQTEEIKEKLINTFVNRFPQDASRILNSASTPDIHRYLQHQDSDTCLKILLGLSGDVAADVLEEMDEQLFLTIFENADAYSSTLLLSRMDNEALHQKLRLFTDKKTRELRELMTYPTESAGFLMDTRIVTFQPETTVDGVLNKLRSLGDNRILTIYVVDQENRLIGVIPLQLIAISPPDQVIRKLMKSPVVVHAMAPREEVVGILQDRNLTSLPVVDLDQRILGIIRYDALIKAAQQEAIEDVQTIFGAGREERALSHVGFAIKKRLPWLEINLATAFLAASVVGAFEETIAQITVLAVFLPVVAGQSGNTGSQALAVTIRGLALREFRMNQWWRVARKEVAVGFFNGVVVALTTAVIVFFWASSFGLAVVIGVSMIFSMVIAGFSGAVIPIILKSFGQDPAQSSSIILTTVTDIVGFLSFLGLATAMISMLGLG